MGNYILLIVFIPFLSALIMAMLYLFGSKKSNFIYTFIGVLAPLVVTILTFIVAFSIDTNESLNVVAFQWVAIENFNINLAFTLDRLSAVMILFITFISTLIHIYTIGYMQDDDGYGKFFSYFNFFLGSMLILVLGSNPIVMFMGWELVGLASYLLIGFYYKDTENIKAANKAFIANRVGDFGFIIGISLLFISLNMPDFTFANIEANISLIDNDTLTIIGLLLFVGAMGKSAQVPLYVWLPDAMAGPTPVSALIHAATMVTAGVYMVARFGFLYNEIPDVGLFIATIGAISALFAAIIASYQSDIKKILAYSTMSQLGYMFIAVGLGAYSYGIFHVFTHAFFKALLFMGAGAVIVALHHEQNIFKMGKLKKLIPVVYITMFIGVLAISGIPPFAGFFSKDAILIHAFQSEHYVIWIVGVITAFLTAFYMFRMLFIVFIKDQENQHNIHKLSKTMTMPLIVLAIGAGLAGFLNANEAYGGADLFSHFINLPDVLFTPTHTLEYSLGFLNTIVATLGIFVAYRMFIVKTVIQPSENTVWNKLVINKFFVDELYDKIIVKPLFFLSTHTKKTFDNLIVDGFINLVVSIWMKLSFKFGNMHNGKVQYYSLYILIGVSMISLIVLFEGGL